MQKFFRWLDSRSAIGLLLVRLFAGVRLVYGVVDNVFSWKHMLLFSDFLHQYHFPVPLVSAIISVYAQLIAGLMFVFGWKIRYAAILMIINFLVAILAVHLGQSFEQMTPALSLLFISILFLFQGAGKYSIREQKIHYVRERKS